MKTGTYRFKEPIKGCEFISRLENILQNEKLSNLPIEPTNPALRRLKISFLGVSFVEMTLNRAFYYSDLVYTISIKPTLPDGLYECMEHELKRVIGCIDLSHGFHKLNEQTIFLLGSSTFDMAELNDEFQEEVKSYPK